MRIRTTGTKPIRLTSTHSFRYNLWAAQVPPFVEGSSTSRVLRSADSDPQAFHNAKSRHCPLKFNMGLFPKLVSFCVAMKSRHLLTFCGTKTLSARILPSGDGDSPESGRSMLSCHAYCQIGMSSPRSILNGCAYPETIIVKGEFRFPGKCQRICFHKRIVDVEFCMEMGFDDWECRGRRSWPS
jgi:hypothetical protein